MLATCCKNEQIADLGALVVSLLHLSRMAKYEEPLDQLAGPGARWLVQVLPADPAWFLASTSFHHSYRGAP